MATRTTVELLDDIDGKPAAETIGFGLDGVEYEIDVSEKNAKALRKALETWLPASRRVGGRVTRATATRVATGVDNHAVRAWAASSGIELSSRGRIAARSVLLVDRKRRQRLVSEAVEMQPVHSDPAAPAAGSGAFGSDTGCCSVHLRLETSP